MICPYRHGVKMDVEVINGKAVVTSQEEFYPECYKSECPYYDYTGSCRAIESELGD